VQFRHDAELFRPVPSPYEPAQHWVHADTPVFVLYVPDWHDKHCDLFTNVPARQARHELPEPSALVPALQFWQTVLVPS
jgi:hypothetical protein